MIGAVIYLCVGIAIGYFIGNKKFRDKVLLYIGKNKRNKKHKG